MVVPVPCDSKGLIAESTVVGLGTGVSSQVRNSSLLLEGKEGARLPFNKLGTVVLTGLLVVDFLDMLSQALSACVAALAILNWALERPLHRADWLGQRDLLLMWDC
jgi:hypothetical protein